MSKRTLFEQCKYEARKDEPFRDSSVDILDETENGVYVEMAEWSERGEPSLHVIRIHVKVDGEERDERYLDTEFRDWALIRKAIRVFDDHLFKLFPDHEMNRTTAEA
jgi:hypothetical protein